MNRTGSRILHGMLLATSALVASPMIASTTAMAAGPMGGSVAIGNATITNPSATQTVINQSSKRALINWNSFSVSSGSSVQFNQPNSKSLTVNRVTGPAGSVIDGSILANGNVWLLNANGILFGKGSQINVGALLATTSELSDADFTAGNNNFTASPNPNASVVNQGTINASRGGSVVLSAPRVSNEGLIQADLGTVVLGGASAFTVDMTGDNLLRYQISAPVTQAPKDADGKTASALVTNSGTVAAQGGHVLMTARAAQNVEDNVINNTGMVEATSVSVHNGEVDIDAGPDGTANIGGTVDASGAGAGQTGGTVTATGNTVNVTDGATIKVSGNAGGGAVQLGGGMHGQGTLAHAQNVNVGNATINADATSKGNGGNVTVWSDGATRFAGAISARGGAQGGNGGQVETSGHTLGVAPTATVDTSAPLGLTGDWLLDPDTIIIELGGNTSLSGGTLALTQDSGQTDTIAPSTITGALVNTDVTLQAATEIQIAANGALNYTSAHALNLLSQGEILVGASIQNSGTGDINLVAGWDGTTTNPASFTNNGVYGSGTGLVQINNSAAVGSKSGNTTIAGGAIDIGIGFGGTQQVGYNGAGTGNIAIVSNNNIILNGTDAGTVIIGNGVHGCVTGAVGGNVSITTTAGLQMSPGNGTVVIGNGEYGGGHITGAVSGDIAINVGSTFEIDSGAVRIGNEDGTTTAGNLTVIAGTLSETNTPLENNFITDLSYGDVLFGIGGNYTYSSGNASFTSAHDFAILSSANLTVPLDIVNDGTGNITLVGGWNATGAYSSANVSAAAAAHTLASLFAGSGGAGYNGAGNVTIGGASATGDVSVGSSGGLTTVAANNVFVDGENHDALIGAVFNSTGGDIQVLAANNLSMTASGSFGEAQIGNIRSDDGLSGNVVLSVGGNITLDNEGSQSEINIVSAGDLSIDAPVTDIGTGGANDVFEAGDTLTIGAAINTGTQRLVLWGGMNTGDGNPGAILDPNGDVLTAGTISIQNNKGGTSDQTVGTALAPIVVSTSHLAIATAADDIYVSATGNVDIGDGFNGIYGNSLTLTASGDVTQDSGDSLGIQVGNLTVTTTGATHSILLTGTGSADNKVSGTVVLNSAADADFTNSETTLVGNITAAGLIDVELNNDNQDPGDNGDAKLIIEGLVTASGSGTSTLHAPGDIVNDPLQDPSGVFDQNTNPANVDTTITADALSLISDNGSVGGVLPGDPSTTFLLGTSANAIHASTGTSGVLNISNGKSFVIGIAGDGVGLDVGTGGGYVGAANGNITQLSGDDGKISATDITFGAGTSGFTLDNSENDVSGNLTLYTPGNANFTNNGATNLGGIAADLFDTTTVGGNFTLTVLNGPLTQTGALYATNLTIDASNGVDASPPITLTDTANDVTGTFSAITPGGVSFTNSAGITLGDVNGGFNGSYDITAGDIDIVALSGGINVTGTVIGPNVTLMAPGNITQTHDSGLDGGNFTVTSTAANIALVNTNNELSGTVDISAANGTASFGNNAETTLGTVTALGDVVVLSEGNLTITSSIEQASASNITLIAGWDGTTTSFTAPLTSGTFGNSCASIQFSGNASIGSQSGTTTVAGYDVDLDASTGFAQIGYQGEGGGDIFVDAAHDVSVTGDSNDSGGDAHFARIGNSGASTTQTGNITVTAGGNVTLASGNSNNAAQIGNGGGGDDTAVSGNITINAGGDVTLTGGSQEPVQIGNGAENTNETTTGDIVVNATGNVSLIGSNGHGFGLGGDAQIGNGGYFSSTSSGNVTVIAGNNVTLTSDPSANQFWGWTQIGNGGPLAGDASGNISVTAGNLTVTSGNEYAQIGNGGIDSSDNSGDITVNVTGTVTLTGTTTDDGGYALIGLGGNGTFGTNAGNISVTAGNLSMVGFNNTTFAQIGNFDGDTNGGDIAINVTGTLDLDGTNGTVAVGNSGGTTNTGNVTIVAGHVLNEGEALESSILSDLAGGNVIVGVKGDSLTFNTTLSGAYSNSNNLTLLADTSLYVDSSLQNAGSGNITLVSGWNGASTNATTVIGSSQYGFNTGDIYIGGSDAVGSVAVGSALGKTTLGGAGIHVEGDKGYAQIGYHGTANGSIDIHGTGTLALESGEGKVAQIGHGATFGVASATGGNITIDVSSISNSGTAELAGNSAVINTRGTGDIGRTVNPLIVGLESLAIPNTGPSGTGANVTISSPSGGLTLGVGGLGMNLGSDSLTLTATGDIVESSNIIAGSVNITAVTGNISFTQGNDVGFATLSAAAGNVTFFNDEDLSVGDVTALGDTLIAATNNVTILGSNQNTGSGNITIVAGWDGTTTAPGAFKTNPTTYGNNSAELTIGGLNATGDVAVGSAGGITSIFSDGVLVEADNGFAQLGYGNDGGTGAINVFAKGDLAVNATGGCCGTACEAVIGNGFNGTVAGNITIVAAGAITLDAHDTGTTAVIGNNGANVSGEIHVTATNGSVTLETEGTDALAQIGNFGRTAAGGNIAVTVIGTGGLSLNANATGSGAVIRNAGGDNIQGNITVTVPGDINLAAKQSTAVAQIGNDAGAGTSGDVNLNATGNVSFTQQSGGTITLGDPTAQSGNLTILASAITEDATELETNVIGDLAGGDVTVGVTGSGAYTFGGNSLAAQSYSSAHNLALLAAGNLIVSNSIQNAGNGNITLVGGWDGTHLTGLANTGVFGASTGNVTIGGVVSGNVSVGSSGGSTIVEGHNVVLQATNGTTQVGYHGAATGSITVRTTGNVSLLTGAGVSNASIQNWADIGHGDLNDTVSGNTSGDILLAVGGFLKSDDSSDAAWIGNYATTGFGSAGNVTIVTNGADINSAGGYLFNDLAPTTGAGGNLFIGFTGPTGNYTFGGMNYTSANTLTVAAAANLTITGSLTDNGLGNINVVDGWDGHTTTLSALGNSGVYGNNSTTLTVGGTGASSTVVIGSKSGATNVYAKNLIVSATNNTAQIGYRGAGTGAINVSTLGDLTVIGQGANLFALIGNGGPNVTSAVGGNITVNAHGNVSLAATANNSIVDIGNVGGDGSSQSGNITVTATGALSISANPNSNAQIGNLQFGTVTPVNLGTASGNIQVTAASVLLQGLGSSAFAQIGNGYTSQYNGNVSGDITINTGNLTLSSTGGTGAGFARIGARAAGNQTTNITIVSSGDVLASAGNFGNAIIGNGGPGNSVGSVNLNTTGNLTLVSGGQGSQARIGAGAVGTTGDLTVRAAGAISLIASGAGSTAHIANFGSGAVNGNISVVSTAGNILLETFNSDAYARIGLQGTDPGAVLKGNIAVSAANGSIDATTSGTGTIAQIGDGNGVFNSATGNVTLTARDIFLDANGTGSIVQVGNGIGSGNVSGNITLTATAGDVDVGSVTGSAQIGNGGYLWSGTASGAIGINASNAVTVSADGNGAVAQIGNGGAYSNLAPTSGFSETGDIAINASFVSLDDFGANGSASIGDGGLCAGAASSFCQATTGQTTSGSVLFGGNIAINAGFFVTVEADGTGNNLAWIGSGGDFSGQGLSISGGSLSDTGTISMNIPNTDPSEGGVAVVADAPNSEAHIGNGGYQANAAASASGGISEGGNINLKATQFDIVAPDTTDAAWIGNGGDSASGNASGDITLAALAGFELLTLNNNADTRIGNGGASFTGTASGNISLTTAAGGVTMAVTGNSAGTTIGNTGGLNASEAGNIAINTNGSALSMQSSGSGSFAHIGNWNNAATTGSASGNIAIAAGDITLDSNGQRSFAQIGNGDFHIGNTGTLSGNININAASLKLSAESAGTNSDQSRIGNLGTGTTLGNIAITTANNVTLSATDGGLVNIGGTSTASQGAETGDILVQAGGAVLLSVTDFGNARIESGGISSGNVSVTANGDITLVANGTSNGAQGLVLIGAIPSGNGGANVTVTSTSGDVVLAANTAGSTAQIGNSDNPPAGAVTGNINVSARNVSLSETGSSSQARIGNSGSGGSVGGDIFITAANALTSSGDSAVVGNTNPGGVESGNVTIVAVSAEDAGNSVLDDLAGGDFTLTTSGSTLLNIDDTNVFNSAHNLSVTTGGDIIFASSLQNTGTGSLTFIAGGDVTIGGGTASGGVAVGSQGGTTTIDAKDLLLAASNGYAQVGYHGGGSGSIVVATSGNITLSGGGSQAYFAQIGDGGYQVTGSNSGPISVNAGGSVTLTAGSGQEAYAQVGNGGAESNSSTGGYTNTGAITLNARTLALTAGSGTGSYAQIGDGGYKSGQSLSGIATLGGDIKITAVSAVTMAAGGAEAYAQIGSGGSYVNSNVANGSSGTTGGNISVLVSSPGTNKDAIVMLAGTGVDSYVQIGNGGVFENLPVSGAKVNFTVSGNVAISDLALTGGSVGANSYAQIGDGDAAKTGTGNIAGNIVIASGTSFTVKAGTAPGAGAGIANNTGFGTVTGTVSGYNGGSGSVTDPTVIGSLATIVQNKTGSTFSSMFGNSVLLSPSFGGASGGFTAGGGLSQSPSAMDNMFGSGGDNEEVIASDGVAHSIGDSLNGGKTYTTTKTLIPGVLKQIVVMSPQRPHGVPSADEDYSSWGNEALWRW